MKNEYRHRLRAAAARIAANRNELPASPGTALRKIFIQERRNWSLPNAPRTGWKRGELVEVLQAIGTPDLSLEWGDIGYYAAQSWAVVWWLYAILTPVGIMETACSKFENRAVAGKKTAK